MRSMDEVPVAVVKVPMTGTVSEPHGPVYEPLGWMLFDWDATILAMDRARDREFLMFLGSDGGRFHLAPTFLYHGQLAELVLIASYDLDIQALRAVDCWYEPGHTMTN